MSWWGIAVIAVVVLILMLWAAYRIVEGMPMDEPEEDPYDSGWDADDDQWWPQDNPDPVSYMPPEAIPGTVPQAYRTPLQRDALNFNAEGMRTPAMIKAEQAVHDAAARARAGQPYFPRERAADRARSARGWL